ncbi:MAG: protein-glutamate O-methyltransferase CheR [Proteobacteria bacterium]|nr:protein-glutamate O-methyltransferase CheR [Pseudomonadota bacterium]
MNSTVTEASVSFIAEVVLKRSGLILSADKGYLVESRINPVARKEGFASIDALVAAMRARKDEKLMWAVTDALTTNETFFFRDKTPFDQFRDEVLPALKGRSTLRVWCAACSTGQEPYSLAMLMEEVKGTYPGMKLDICASDISERVLEKAQAGLYSKFEVQRGLPITHLVKYFEPAEDAFRVKPALRQSIRWRPFNLLDDPRVLGRFDVVFCRNVLIYFDPPTKQKVLERIASVTAPDGFLFLGAAETVMGVTDAFKAIPAKRGLYGRDAGVRKAA